MKTTYVVYRHGSNAANQPMTEAMAIGQYVGHGDTSKERVIDVVHQAYQEHDIYNNQYLSAIPVSRCSRLDRLAAYAEQRARAEALAAFESWAP